MSKKTITKEEFAELSKVLDPLEIIQKYNIVENTLNKIDSVESEVVFKEKTEELKNTYLTSQIKAPPEKQEIKTESLSFEESTYFEKNPSVKGTNELQIEKVILKINNKITISDLFLFT